MVAVAQRQSPISTLVDLVHDLRRRVAMLEDSGNARPTNEDSKQLTNRLHLDLNLHHYLEQNSSGFDFALETLMNTSKGTAMDHRLHVFLDENEASILNYCLKKYGDDKEVLTKAVYALIFREKADTKQIKLEVDSAQYERQKSLMQTLPEKLEAQGADHEINPSIPTDKLKHFTQYKDLGVRILIDQNQDSDSLYRALDDYRSNIDQAYLMLKTINDPLARLKEILLEIKDFNRKPNSYDSFRNCTDPKIKKLIDDENKFRTILETLLELFSPEKVRIADIVLYKPKDHKAVLQRKIESIFPYLYTLVTDKKCPEKINRYIKSGLESVSLIDRARRSKQSDPQIKSVLDLLFVLLGDTISVEHHKIVRVNPDPFIDYALSLKESAPAQKPSGFNSTQDRFKGLPGFDNSQNN